MRPGPGAGRPSTTRRYASRRRIGRERACRSLPRRGALRSRQDSPHRQTLAHKKENAPRTYCSLKRSCADQSADWFWKREDSSVGEDEGSTEFSREAVWTVLVSDRTAAETPPHTYGKAQIEFVSVCALYCS